VVHIITGLDQGGAEATLYRLIMACGTPAYHSVISLTDEGVYGDRLRMLGVKVESLNMPRGSLSISSLFRLYCLLRSWHPSVVQTWMYHADLMGGVIAKMAGVRKVVWNVRHSNLDPCCNNRGLLKVAKLCAFFSSWVPDHIVCCSEEARRVHMAIGYKKDIIVIIPNGYNLSVFLHDENAGKSLREELGVSDKLLVGMVARWDPQKDHANLFAAMSKVWNTRKDVQLLCVGSEMTEKNENLLRIMRNAGGDGKTLLVGPRDDIPRVMNALDLHVLSSVGEAFPNCVAEAMACGTPCVVTDVGDAKLIVGDTGWISPPGNPEAFAEKILEALTDLECTDKATRARRCRIRIEENFSLLRMVAAYEQLWESMLPKREC